MEPSDYITAWVVYLLAAAVFSIVAWRVLRRLPWRELAYLLECWLLALLLTPWYVLPDQDILAPALIVFVLETVTIAPTAGIRALIPLILMLFVMLVVAVLLSVLHRIRLRRHRLLVSRG